MKPSNPPSKTGRSRPWPPRLFAVGAVVLLVVSGLVVVISGLMRGSTSHDPAQEQASYASDALARIDALSSLDDVASRGRDLGAADIGADEVAQLAQELAAAQAGLESALAAADHLPAVPVGYIPGADVVGDLPAYVAAPYALPKLDGKLTLGKYVPEDVLGDASPVQPRSGIHVPATGNPAVDGAMAQLIGACIALRDLLAQATPATGAAPALPDPCTINGLEGLPVPDPQGLVPGGIPTDPFGVLGPLPVGDPTGLLGGVLPSGNPSSQMQGANDAVDPDEQGAILAEGHAGKILGVTSGAYGRANETLQQLLVSYSGLATQLQDLLDAADQKATETADQLPVVLQERLAAITAQADHLRSEADRLSAEYTGTAQAAATQALGMAQDAVKAHMADLQSTLDSQVAGLNAQAALVMKQAGTRSDAITALVDSAKANLTRMSADSGIDATAQIAAIQASGDAAVKSLEAQAKAEVETLKETAALLQARAQAAVPRMTGMALRATETINGTLEGALAKASDAKEYALDLATAQAALATEGERSAQALALKTLEETTQGYKAKLKATAKALVETVPDFVNSTSALVQKTSDLADTQVGKDLDYIAKVASDYSKVPTNERKARAQFWSLVDHVGEESLVTLGQAGDDLSALSQEVAAAAALAQSDVDAIANA